MKRLLSLLVVAGFGLAASAQTSPVKFGVKAGVTFPTLNLSGADSGNESTNPNTSFYIGGTADIPLSQIFSVQPGLSLIGKGGKEEENLTINNVKISSSSKVSLMYIEVPVNLVANFAAGEGKFFVGAGPYYGIAITGKTKVKFTNNGNTQSVDQDVKFGKDGDLKRGDFGLNFLAGYQLKNGFNIHAGYGLGLSNLATGDSADGKVTNRVLSVGLGYSF